MRIQEFVITDDAAGPYGITTGQDGSLWFTRTGDGTVTGWDLPTPRSEPHGLAVDPDGGVRAALEIGRLVRVQP